MRKKVFAIGLSVVVLVALIAVLVPGCDGGETYTLTMAVSPAGSGTATDLIAASPYAKDTAVKIQAAAAAGYQFVKWTAPAGTFANPNAATTTFTMSAQDVTVTAHFVGPLDHFKCYYVPEAPSLEEVYVSLKDQFVDDLEAQVGAAEWFGNPVEKVHGENVTSISNPDHHLTFYSIYYEEEYVMRSVEVSNQFGTQNLTVYGPLGLAVPTQKVEPRGHEPPLCLDHFLLYFVIEGSSVNATVDLTDQFVDEEVLVGKPVLFANPVQKTHGVNVTEIWDPDEHLVFYSMEKSAAPEPPSVQLVNQFGNQTLDLSYADLLAVPSEKIVPPVPPLDHFKCYLAEGPPLEDVYVDLEDQFDYFYAQVKYADWFCNPVDKVHGGQTTLSNPDNHLTIYTIAAPQTSWSVVVDNQFGYGQELIVSGPVALAVPTQKLEPGGHPEPQYLDHFLLYKVDIGSSVNAIVDLDDQFPESAPEVSVTTPIYFANPVVKGHVNHITAPWNPEAHLVFYEISSNPEFLPLVLVNNQFKQELTLFLSDELELLAVPSEKISWEVQPPL